MSYTVQTSNIHMAADGVSKDVSLHVVSADAKTESMTPGATLVFRIDETLDISVRRAGAQSDMRGRWDKVQWRHYRTLASGIQQVLALMLDLPLRRVKTDGSLLCDETTAIPRLIVEVPIEYKDRVEVEEVREAICVFVDRIMGGSAGGGMTDEAPERSREVSSLQAVVAPTVNSTKSELPVAQLEAVAVQILSKVGGATLPVQCQIEMEGWKGPVASMSGRFADKPALLPSDPTTESMECFVDGYIRSRHTVYLIPIDSYGVAKEAAMGPEWEDRVAEYALCRGHRFAAEIKVVQQGQKVTRELVSLVKVDECSSNDLRSQAGSDV